MSISPFDAGDNPAPPDSHLHDTAGRLVDLQTGELSFGDFGSLLDAVFGAATAERSAEHFSEARAPQRREAPGLVKRAIAHRSLALFVHEDVMVVRAAPEKAPEEKKAFIPEGTPSKRGKITGFSRRSRRRFIVALAMARNVSGGYFCSLTFPDSVVAAFAEPGDWGEYAHRCLDIFETAAA